VLEPVTAQTAQTPRTHHRDESDVVVLGTVPALVVHEDVVIIVADVAELCGTALEGGRVHAAVQERRGVTTSTHDRRRIQLV